MYFSSFFIETEIERYPKAKITVHIPEAYTARTEAEYGCGAAAPPARTVRPALRSKTDISSIAPFRFLREQTGAQRPFLSYIPLERPLDLNLTVW